MAHPISFSEIETAASEELAAWVRLSPDSLTFLLSLAEIAKNDWMWELDKSDPAAADRRDNLVAKTSGELMTSMIGVVFPVTWSGPQPGTLLCDGSSYLRSDYPALWAVTADSLKTETHVTVPDLRHKFIYGATDDIGASGGAETHTLTTAEMPTHSHTYTAPINLDLDLEDVGIPQVSATVNPFPQFTSEAGLGQAHNNMPPHTRLIYVVLAL